MPKFFFDVFEKGRRVVDCFGEVYVDLDEACDQAVCLLPDLARDILPDGCDQEFACEVRDEENRVVYRACLALKTERVDDLVFQPRHPTSSCRAA